MKKLLAAIAVPLLVIALGAANAEETKGVIKELNANEAWLTLQDGTRFVVIEGIGIGDLSVGDEVTVSYEVKDGQNVAVDVSSKSGGE